jgi:hypothetical protein
MKQSASPRYIQPVTEEELTHLKPNATQEEVVEMVDNAAVQTSSEANESDMLEPTEIAVDDRSLDEVKAEEQSDDLYNVKNFAL